MNKVTLNNHYEESKQPIGRDGNCHGSHPCVALGFFIWSLITLSKLTINIVGLIISVRRWATTDAFFLSASQAFSFPSHQNLLKANLVTVGKNR